MVKDKMALPFEVTYSEKPAKKSRTMKRLAVIVKPEKVDGIIATLRQRNLESTIYDVKRADKERERVTSGRGMGTIDLTYTTRKVIATVVNADDVEDVVEIFRGALGKDGGGVVVVSPVDDLIRL
ncbi:MAG TPA: P-II family nitrogen regulator [Nitrososphaera sp.]|nr:P-II family nitrogen regulator [Nitrososphaera sp.]